MTKKESIQNIQRIVGASPDEGLKKKGK